MATKKLKVTVTGTRPILFHTLDMENFGNKAGERKERTGSAGNDPEEWRRTYRATKDGQLYIVPEMIFGALRAAAVYTKSGRMSVQKPLSATLQVMDNKIALNRYVPKEPTPDVDAETYIDIRGVVNPATRGRNIRYRLATREGWQCSFTVMFDTTIVTEPVVNAVLIDAGKLIGLGDARSIGYGRFSIDSVEAVE